IHDLHAVAIDARLADEAQLAADPLQKLQHVLQPARLKSMAGNLATNAHADSVSATNNPRIETSARIDWIQADCHQSGERPSSDDSPSKAIRNFDWPTTQSTRLTTNLADRPSSSSRR